MPRDKRKTRSAPPLAALASGSPGIPQPLTCLPSFRGLQHLFDEEALADVTIVLSRHLNGDGASVPGARDQIFAHKAILSGVSDVLRAQFTGRFSDSRCATWTPEVGSADAWRWTLRWIYGYEEILPSLLLVEVLLISDRYQIESLSTAITLHPTDDIAEDVVFSILSAWACPEALAVLAQRCVPLVVGSSEVWRRMWDSSPQNAALFLRFVPVLCEMDRLRLLSGYVERQQLREKDPNALSSLPDCLFSTVAWEAFPADVLEAATRDDLTGLRAVSGLQLRPSAALREMLFRAIARRCQVLEQQLNGTRTSIYSSRKERNDVYILPLGGDLLRIPTQLPAGGASNSATSEAMGLFARFVSLGLTVSVQLSSVHSRTPPEKNRLFDISEKAQLPGSSAVWHLPSVPLSGHAWMPSSAAATAASPVPTSSATAGSSGSTANGAGGMSGTGGAAASAPHPSGGSGLQYSNHSSAQVLGTVNWATLPPATFGTENQTEEDPPWIEVFCRDCEVAPTAFGLRHGWYDSCYCRSFVVEGLCSSTKNASLAQALINNINIINNNSTSSKSEGENEEEQQQRQQEGDEEASASGRGSSKEEALKYSELSSHETSFSIWPTVEEEEDPSPKQPPTDRGVNQAMGASSSEKPTEKAPKWIPLLSRSNHLLTCSGEVFRVEGLDEGLMFDRFRIRMTAPNSVGSWHLMVNWFDVYGQFRAKSEYFMSDGCRVEATL